MKYEPSATIPTDPDALASWLLDEFRRVAAALGEGEPDSMLLKEWNAVPDKLYNGLVAYADGTNWDPGLGRGLYAYLNGTWQIATPVIRSIRFEITPGATPATNINVNHNVGSADNYNEVSLTNATDLAKSGSSGSYALSADGRAITVTMTPNVLAILSSHIYLQDMNNTSVLDVYMPSPGVTAAKLLLQIHNRSVAFRQDWLAVMAAGDRCELVVCFITDS